MRACELCGHSDGAITVAYDSWDRDHSYHEECSEYGRDPRRSSPAPRNGRNEWAATEENVTQWRPKVQGARETFGPTFHCPGLGVIPSRQTSHSSCGREEIERERPMVGSA